ncbi:MAG: 30S ribosomal protein S20, partial [Candidatus Methylomirabilales bacterium]
MEFLYKIRYRILVEDGSMPNTRSAAKQLRQAQVRALRNRRAKSRLRTTIKRVRHAVETGNREAAVAAFQA